MTRSASGAWFGRALRTLCIASVVSGMVFPGSLVAQLPFEVVPDGAGRTVEPNTSDHLATFSVWNNKEGSGSDTFALNCDPTGTVSTCDAPSAVTVDRGGTADLDAYYAVSGTGTGRVTLGATDVYDTDGYDDGYYSITVASSQPPAASVDVWPHAVPSLFQPNTSDTVGFTIKNTGTVAGEFTLQATCTTYATNCQTNLGSVSLAAGAETARTVSFTSPPDGESGTVALRATNTVDAVKTDLATATVESDGHADFTAGPATEVPIITITPAYKKLYGTTRAVEVDIIWCLPGPGTWQSMVIDNEYPGGKSYLTSTFTTEHGQAPQPAECSGPNDSWARSSGTVAVREGGLNRITASAYTSGGQYSESEAQIQIIPPYRAVAVVAAGQEAEAVAGSGGHTARFGITNQGVATDTFNLAQACTSPLVCTSTPSPQVILGPGASTDVTTTYSVGSTIGEAGLVRLVATHARDATVIDSSWTEVTIVPTPSAGIVLTGGGAVLERDLCLTAAAGPAAAVECGDLRLVHALPSVRTMHKSRTPVLLFNSQHADPMPMVSANVTLAAGDDRNGTVVTNLTINGTTYSQTRNASEWDAPLVRERITIGFDAGAYATGLYTYQLEVRRINGASNTQLGLLSGELPAVNRRQSPFGGGWWLAGLEELVIQGDSIMWVGGDGSTRRYRPWPAPRPGSRRPSTVRTR